MINSNNSNTTDNTSTSNINCSTNHTSNNDNTNSNNCVIPCFCNSMVHRENDALPKRSGSLLNHYF